MNHYTEILSSGAQRVTRAFACFIGVLILAVAMGGCVRDDEPLTSQTSETPSATTPPGSTPPGSTPPGSTPPGSTPPPTTPPTSTPPPEGTPPPVDPNPPSTPPPATDLAAFQITLYPKLRDPANFCVGCHGVAQIPTFAVDDVMTAYNVIISQQKVDLINPALSRVYLRPSVDRHNCGATASCDRVAADILAAIQAWAQQRPAPTPTQTTLKSSKTSFAAAAAGGGARAQAAQIAFFDFEEGTGTTTADTSGVGTAMTLQLTGTEWVEGGLKIVTGKAQASLADSQKLFNMIMPTGAFSAEAWLIPENLTQTGPARIVSYSTNTGTRNFMIGQNAAIYRVRNRSSVANANGDPALDTTAADVKTELQHVVMTFDPAVGRKIYVNGQVAAQETAPATLAWTNDQLFVLGNEVTNDRLWKGVFEMVAIHSKALSAAEVQQNFQAGTGNFVTLQFDVSSILGNPARIDMLAAQVDDKSYVFAKPTFVSAATGIRVKNIRVAVNDAVPVAAQSFRRIDTTVMASGTELSRLGAVIPAAQGPAMDQFHLEFELLGGRTGEAEAIAASAPPAPAPDVPEALLGVRSFSKVNDTFAAATGIASTTAAISTLYTDVRDSLPATDDILSFGSAQQVAIQRLATAYCGQIVADTTRCSNFFGACTIAAAGKPQIIDRVYDRLIGVNLANQPDRAAVTTELVDVMNDLGCTNGCTGATATTALQATCAAALSSAAVTVN